MKLWEKGIQTHQKIEQFTVGQDRELDLLLAPYDVLGSLAHSKMLKSIGILGESELAELETALREIYREMAEGNFIIQQGVEDVHSQVELMLTEKLGAIGKKIHSGRSRNDQVLVDIRLYCRQQIKELVAYTEKLFFTLLELADQHKNALMPGYTHFQVAMPSSFGLWFSAYAESLIDDLQMLLSAFKIINQNPLGSAAGYGTSFPLDRQMTTQLLGFEDLNYNVVYAQMGRGKTEKMFSFALSSLAASLSKMAYDVCLYTSQNFNFISLPDELTTGSSIMPHKKNPDVFELIRAKTNKIQALPNEIILETNNLPSGYHRDFQVLKENFFPAIESLKSCLEIAEFGIAQVKVNEDILSDERYRYIFSVEKVNQEVLKGIPFREAYQNIAKQINDHSYTEKMEVNHSHQGSIGNLCLPEIKGKFLKVKSQFNFQVVEDAEKALLNNS